MQRPDVSVSDRPQFCEKNAGLAPLLCGANKNEEKETMYHRNNGYNRPRYVAPQARFSSPVAIDRVIDALMGINQLAHACQGNDAKALYQLKARILSAVLACATEDQFRIEYQAFAADKVLLLFQLVGMRSTRCFHVPIEQLDKAAQVAVFNQLGSQTAFLTRVQRT
jgi:hypothetical protein